MSSSAKVRRPGRGRRPTAEVRTAALEIAGDLLFSQGIEAVTHERVSAQAGVSKTTLYKHWPIAGKLAVEAYLRRSEPALELPDSGSFAEDLRKQMRGFIALVTSEDVGRAIRGILAAAQQDETIREAYLQGYVLPRRAYTFTAFSTAQKRGEIRSDANFTAFIDQLWGACYYRLLVEPETVTHEYGDLLVQQALFGIVEDAT